jgi:hypothetical protein
MRNLEAGDQVAGTGGVMCAPRVNFGYRPESKTLFKQLAARLDREADGSVPVMRGST